MKDKDSIKYDQKRQREQKAGQMIEVGVQIFLSGIYI